MVSDLDKFLSSISKSKFRGSFHLNEEMKLYVSKKGLDVIKVHAYGFVNDRLASSYIENDGKQTPMKQVHPVFIAQHATGCCCRGCLEKIHKIPKNKELTKNEIDYIVNVIMRYIELECNREVNDGRNKKK